MIARGVLALGLAMGVAGGASGFELSVGASLKGQTERLSLSHDASFVDPILGNPTSLLEYGSASSIWAELSLSGRDMAESGLWFDLAAAVPLTGWGNFDDYDYLAGQLVFSHTSSGVAIGEGLTGALRVPMPFLGELRQDNLAIRPYLTASMERRTLSATGLSCGVICGPLPAVPSDLPVISHDLSGWQAGAGVWLAVELSQTQTLDVHAELVGGRLGVSDTHFLRTDLGPAPHIAYDFATLGVQVRAAYTHALTDALAFTAAAGGSLRRGTGTATFGASLPSPIGTFDADLVQMSGTLSLGLHATF
ncbi:hypothetical protein [Pelagibacterium lacus]|uniref:Uncharacterized protein n=1 Tax=Pelagibacterium lacus TaxID=2282655 RepID=A0A369W4H5_9HYPH|nr:hypothetical protein [Pelagibacterium lacus]RDE08929.1 hypothetical protein DVH29_09265 [Pelagibacterium lacus]